MRPVVTVSVPGKFSTMEPALGLVDTGSENVLAASWLADLAGIDLGRNVDRAVLGIGGQNIEVTFAEIELRLHRPEDASEWISWRSDIGFVTAWQAPFAIVLGQTGFLDQFTVTFHRGAAMLAVEAWEAFDSRFRTGAAT